MLPASTVYTAGLTVTALVAFASNSILTRMALETRHIDAATFTTVRLAAGAVVLAALVRAQAGGWARLRGRGVAGPLALFAYAAPFSFAYLRVGAAIGALVLFGAVQLTMIGWGIARGDRPSGRVWAGLVLAAAGLVALNLRSASLPDPLGMALMVTAGVAWGAYSLLGKGAADPLAANARSFLWGVPLSLLVSVATARAAFASPSGLALAVTSGAITSGLGYAIWYRALRGLTAAQAAIVQLSVPVIAALGAVVLLDERLTPRFVACAVTVLVGVALAIRPARRQ